MPEVTLERSGLGHPRRFPFPVPRPSDNVAFQLLNIEILYILNLQPSTLNGLSNLLMHVFDIAVDIKVIQNRVQLLEEWGYVQTISILLDHPCEKEDVYVISQRGMTDLTDSMESLSTIALTMQLGLEKEIGSSLTGFQ